VDEAVAEIVAAFAQQTSKQVELVQYEPGEIMKSGLERPPR
jgi:hypothetical protein